MTHTQKTRHYLTFAMFFFMAFTIMFCDSYNPKTILTPTGARIDNTGLKKFIAAQMAQYQVPGLAIAIINGDSIVFQETFGVTTMGSSEKMGQKTIFEAASLSKPLFAYFVMKQVDKGLLDLDTPLYQYVDYTDIIHDQRYKLITPRMVLSHTTGLPNWRSGQLNFRFAPGTRYAYSGEGFQYLARATAQVNNVDRDGLFEVFERDVAQPLNATRLYFYWNEDVAQHKATGHREGKVGSNGPSDFRTEEFGSAHNLHTDIESYARFIAAILSQKNLSEGAFQEMLKPQVAIPTEDYESVVSGNTRWSLGFGVKETPNGPMYSHGGNNGFFTAYMLFYPEREFGLVLFSNSEKIMFSNFTNEIASYLQTDLRMDLGALNRLMAKYE
ncbi:MAG: serine hydrolase domain-containing protein [Bacteroidota bacterium]